MHALLRLGSGSLLLTLLATAGPAPGSPPKRGVDLLGDAFQGVALGDSVAEVTRKLEGQQEELRTIDVDPPVLPLAGKTETHLVALGVHAVGVEEVAFTFGDDALVLVEARGGVDGLLFALEEEPRRLLDFEVWLDAGVVAQPENDVLWLLGPAALHSHLFLWANPDLPSVPRPAQPFAASGKKPAILDFGAELEELLPRFDAACPGTQREEIGSPWLPTNPQVQTQINCYGVVYAGFPRKIEAVFGDGTLQLAWILTGAGEEARLRAALVEAYGEPLFVSKTWEAFDDWRVALRKDKPEVLMIADELVPTYREQMRATGD